MVRDYRTDVDYERQERYAARMGELDRPDLEAMAEVLRQWFPNSGVDKLAMAASMAMGLRKRGFMIVPLTEKDASK